MSRASATASGRGAAHAGARPGPWRWARLGVLASLVVAMLGSSVGPVVADPAVPTHYRSTVTEVVDADGSPVDLDIRVMGGDTYLVVEVPEGSELQVPGYDDEPYIRIQADGEVEVNERSPARWLNDARYGAAEVDVPAVADAEAPPEWVLSGRDGEYAWHDHRIHFMSPSLPSQVDPSLDEVQEVWDWELELVLDGEPVTVRGELAWVPGSGPVVPIVALVVAAAGALLVVRWLGAELGPDALVGVAALGGLGLAVSNNVGLPAGADHLPALWVLPVLAVAAVGVGRARSARDDGFTGPLLRALATIPAAVPAILVFGALWRPIVPGLLPTWATRGLVVVILAASLVSLGFIARQLWASTSLDRWDEDDPSQVPTTEGRLDD